MTVRRRGTLLAGVATLLGLSLAGTGCQSSLKCHSCATGHRVATTAEPASSGLAWRSRPAATVSRPLLAGTGRSVAKDGSLTPIASSAYRNTPAVATMLRPIPASPRPANAVSGWNPVQRVSGEIRIVPDIGSPPSVSLDRPQGGVVAAPPLPMPVETPLQPLPVPAPLVSADPEKVEREPIPPAPKTGSSRTKPRNGNGGKDKELLPAPREVANGNGKREAGYPVLPPPTITHPPVAPREFQKRALSSYILEPPDVLQIEASRDIVDPNQPISGPHLVRPDGTIGLGSYGSVFVAGMTLEQAKFHIVEKIRERQPKIKPADVWEGLKVDVTAYNSKFYYVIADGGGYGETVVRIPITGNETVLDAISQIQGLPVVASKKHIWVARATPHDHHHPMILPVDWYGITQRGSAATNYQIFPGDRVYVNSDVRIRVDSNLAKIFSPIERIFGITLLGATTVNAIKGNQGGQGGF